MDEMSKLDQDIRLSTNFVSAELAKGGGHITMGVDSKTIHDLAFNEGKFLVAIYVIDKEQFHKIKNNEP